MANRNDNSSAIIAASPTSERIADDGLLTRRRKNPTGGNTSISTQQQQQQQEGLPAADLVAVHRAAFDTFWNKTLFSSDTTNNNDPQTEKLLLLQQKRILLASQVAQAKQRLQSNSTTVRDELDRRRQRQQNAKDRPYLNIFKKKKRPAAADDDDDDDDAATTRAVAERDLARWMQQVRHAKKIAAAYRLGGISMLPCPDKNKNNNVLALRFDVQEEGVDEEEEAVFVGCYHCFFDLVVMYENDNDDPNDNHNDDCERSRRQQQEKNKEAMLHMRLIQHTLPPSVPLAAILEKTMGGVACIGPCHDDSQWKTRDIKERLQNCAKEIYQACYCYCARTHAVSVLRSFATARTTTAAVAASEHDHEKNNTSDNDDNQHHLEVPFIIQELQCSDRLDKLSFQLALVSGLSALQVVLTYKDHMRVQPTHVTVQNLAAAESRARRRHEFYDAEKISSDDDDDNDNDNYGIVDDDLIDNATVSFRRLSIRKALEEVSAAMAEW